ncbi:MAG: cobalt-precorrin 5A hydrolase [Lachnospiraceae bacterium]|nr:cobalt-precorrin 5A hydrolase [Lachnospiraceae bacterium]
MKVAIISFTEHGALLAHKVSRGLREQQANCACWLKKKNASASDFPDIQILDGSLSAWTEAQFRETDALIFIGATGIAVRSIAPYVRSKKTDPAVLVMDERGRHVISLLSGHIGGANALTLLAAEITGAEPVITTATDLNGKFAVDAFAARRDLYMDSMPIAKEIAAWLVEGRRVGMRSAFPVFGSVPDELDQNGTQEIGFSVTIRKDAPFERTLHLVPRAVVLGIGCKKGTEEEPIRSLVCETLSRYEIFPESIAKIASIDLKKEEQGLCSFAESIGVPVVTYTAEELKTVQADEEFSESDFVKSVTGVGNVCERAALKCSGARRLLLPKTAAQGVTVAAAVTDYTVCMED